MTLRDFEKLTATLKSSPVMPVLFTSHGSPMDIVLPLNATPFFQSLYQTGELIRSKYEVKAILVVSAHWCTKGTFVNINPQQETIYDYYNFPPEYYLQKYPAPGAPEVAKEVAQLIPAAQETTEWGLDHGSWPMLKHLFPEANVPVFEMSIDYYRPAQYHFELAKQLRSLREKGVLIIGSGSVVHNLRQAVPKLLRGDKTPYGWEEEFDHWLKGRLEDRGVQALVDYEKHPLGLTAAPTPDHYVPMIYSLALMDDADAILHTHEETLPAFSNRSFLIGRVN